MHRKGILRRSLRKGTASSALLRVRWNQQAKPLDLRKSCPRSKEPYRSWGPHGTPRPAQEGSQRRVERGGAPRKAQPSGRGPLGANARLGPAPGLPALRSPDASQPRGGCEDHTTCGESPDAAGPSPHLCNSGRVRRGEPRLLPGGAGAEGARGQRWARSRWLLGRCNFSFPLPPLFRRKNGQQLRTRLRMTSRRAGKPLRRGVQTDASIFAFPSCLARGRGGASREARGGTLVLAPARLPKRKFCGVFQPPSASAAMLYKSRIPQLEPVSWWGPPGVHIFSRSCHYKLELL